MDYSYKSDDFEIKQQNYKTKFFNKTVEQKTNIIEKVNEKTSREFRIKSYCYLNNMEYDMYKVEDICFKKGFILTIKEYMIDYIKTVNKYFNLN